MRLGYSLIPVGALAVGLAAILLPTPAAAFAPGEAERPRLQPGQGVPGGLDGRGFDLPGVGGFPGEPDGTGLFPGGGGEAADLSTPPEVHYGDDDLPAPVRETRAALMDAARSGDPEELRPIIDRMQPPPVLAAGEVADPIDILRGESGDENGREILAIMLDVLDTGWVRRDEGTPRERYVWPYFAAFDPEQFDARQQVELFRLLTSGDFDEMRAAGTYLFYRVEIAPDGRWLAFVAGE